MPSTSPNQILGPDGVIAQRLSHYESRPQQLKMAAQVARAIDRREHLIVEAGTGVGKSFAYLVPAILAAAETNARVVVSTHTIALQEQLYHKDIPFLSSVMPCEFTAELVMGRNNYISLRRLQIANARAASLFTSADDLNQLAELSIWARGRDSGSRHDLDFSPSYEVWDTVASDPSNCLGKLCNTYWQCHFYKSQRRAQKANLLIVNHALLLSDLRLREAGAGLLPDYDVVIFDEAHTLAAAAAEHLGVRITSGGVSRLLNTLYNERTRKGLLTGKRAAEAAQHVRATVSAQADFFEQVADWCSSRGKYAARARTPTGIPNVLGEAMRKLETSIGAVADKVDKPEERIEFDSARARCESLAIELDQWLTHGIEDGVYWAEADARGRGRVTLAAAPLDVGPILRRTLWERGPTCILTSATLCTNNPPSFRYVAESLGLNHPAESSVGSPFDYRNQVTLHLARGLPDPAANAAGYEAAAIRAIPRFLEKTHGKAFVLFTSNRMMQTATEQLRPWFEANGIRLISQSDGTPRAKMLESFKADTDSVLFGVASFWQGVDVPGEALSNVIITKLPFAPPDDPLSEARRERMEKAGKNFFAACSLPEAILALKQGFGRLIRTQTDRGIVVILDPRLQTKAYGSQFLGSLPECTTVIENLSP